MIYNVSSAFSIVFHHRIRPKDHVLEQWRGTWLELQQAWYDSPQTKQMETDTTNAIFHPIGSVPNLLATSSSDLDLCLWAGHSSPKDTRQRSIQLCRRVAKAFRRLNYRDILLIRARVPIVLI